MQEFPWVWGGFPRIGGKFPIGEFPGGRVKPYTVQGLER